MAYPSIEARIMDNVEIQPGPGMTGCWEWQLGTWGKGYARMKLGGKTRLVHRVSYEHFIGPIPVGLQIDHLCANKVCVNPVHLEPTTARINVLRGGNLASKNAKKTHCSRGGHPLVGDNLKTNRDGSRHCIICGNAAARRHYWKKKEQS